MKPSATFVERTVVSGDVTLATRDYGGMGSPLMLLHGLGPTQRSLEKLASSLQGSHRVITYDLRGHGKSGDGVWTFDTALTDLEAIIAAYGLENPAVAGHSLGGMIALHYGVAHPEAPGVVNIDGWGAGRPHQYIGIDPDVAKAELERMIAMRPGSVMGVVLMAIINRIPGSGRRNATLARAMPAVIALDMMALHRVPACPVLAFNATGQVTGLTKAVMGKRGTTMHSAYRDGLRRDLALAVAETPNLTVVEMNASHSLIGTHTDTVAGHITEFLARSRADRNASFPGLGISQDPGNFHCS